MVATVRLQRYLAAAGVAARRKAEELITAGRVTVNGAVVTVLGTKIDPDHDAVTVDGEAVAVLDRFYVLFNKPKGCITAVTDDRGRPTVMDYLPNLPVPVKPVGRLDFYSEGVLLLTNDGELASRLLAPANHVLKTYHVKIHGRLERSHLAALREGIALDDGTTTLPAEIEVLPGESKHTWLGITIHEGKHRQIHRMIEVLGYRVDKLQRVAFANLTFHDLRVGDARELTQPELNQLRDLVGLDHSTVARGRWRALREVTDIPRRARAKARAEQEAAMLDTSAGGDADHAVDREASDRAAPHAGTGGPRAGGVRFADRTRDDARDERRGSRGGRPAGFAGGERTRSDRGEPRGARPASFAGGETRARGERGGDRGTRPTRGTGAERGTRSDRGGPRGGRPASFAGGETRARGERGGDRGRRAVGGSGAERGTRSDRGGPRGARPASFGGAEQPTRSDRGGSRGARPGGFAGAERSDRGGSRGARPGGFAGAERGSRSDRGGSRGARPVRFAGAERPTRSDRGGSRDARPGGFAGAERGARSERGESRGARPGGFSGAERPTRSERGGSRGARPGGFAGAERGARSDRGESRSARPVAGARADQWARSDRGGPRRTRGGEDSTTERGSHGGDREGSRRSFGPRVPRRGRG